MKIRTVLFPLSVAVNILFIAFLILSLSVKTSSLSFQGLGGGVTAASIVSVPESQSASLVFNPFGITLKKGESAMLQYSLVIGGKQANWIITALYDHAVISVSPSPSGVVITALSPGETVMQSVAQGGIADIARVTVTE